MTSTDKTLRDSETPRTSAAKYDTGLRLTSVAQCDQEPDYVVAAHVCEEIERELAEAQRELAEVKRELALCVEHMDRCNAVMNYSADRMMEVIKERDRLSQDNEVLQARCERYREALEDIVAEATEFTTNEVAIARAALHPPTPKPSDVQASESDDAVTREGG